MMQKMDASFANLNNFDPARNVNTMSTSSAGSPPYQLDCGNGGGARSIPVAHHASYVAPIHHNTGRVKTSLKSPHKVPPKTVDQANAIAKAMNKNNVLPKKNIVQAKQPAKNQNYHKPKANITVASKAKATSKVAVH